MALYLVIGLGNPGQKYMHTRHNAGFDVVEVLAQMTKTRLSRVRSRALVGEGRHGEHRLILAQPQTYMNLSGESVQQLVSWYKPDMQNVIVVYDDVDLAPGMLRVRPEGSAGTHNGMRSIISLLGRSDFPRVRVGIGKPPEGFDMADFVVSHYTTEAARKVAFDSFVQAAEAVLSLVEDGAEAAMRKYNRKAEQEAR